MLRCLQGRDRLAQVVEKLEQEEWKPGEQYAIAMRALGALPVLLFCVRRLPCCLAMRASSPRVARSLQL